MRRSFVLGILLATALTATAGISTTASWQLPDPTSKAVKVAEFLPPDPRNIIINKDSL